MSHTSEPQSFHALYAEHSEWLRHWLRRKLGCREQAADIAQDTFVRLLAQRQQVRLSFPRGYLSRIARSLMIDQYRRRLLEQAYLASLAAAPPPVSICAGQREIGFGGSEEATPGVAVAVVHQFDSAVAGARPRVVVSDDELAAHEARLATLRKKAGGRCLWDPSVLEAG